MANIIMAILLHTVGLICMIASEHLWDNCAAMQGLGQRPSPLCGWFSPFSLTI